MYFVSEIYKPQHAVYNHFEDFVDHCNCPSFIVTFIHYLLTYLLHGAESFLRS